MRGDKAGKERSHKRMFKLTRVRDIESFFEKF